MRGLVVRRFVVVGAGIVGASIAYHLARRGASVTLLEQGASPATEVSGHSFAWIGDSGGDWPGGAEDLRPYVLADYRRLESELPGIVVRRTGSLRLGDGEAGTGQRLVGPEEIAALEPGLRLRPSRAVHTPTDAGVDAGEVTSALVTAARALGAQAFYGASVLSVETSARAGRGVTSSVGFHAGDTVVVAAGTETGALCAPYLAAPQVSASPACLLRVAAPPSLVRTIVAAPEFEVREARPGELLVSVPCADLHSGQALATQAQYTFDLVRSAFDGGPAFRLLSHRVSDRPMPAQGPLVGFLTSDQAVYVAVMHSAVTLAPVIGRVVADELVSGEVGGVLSRCHPTQNPK